MSLFNKLCEDLIKNVVVHKHPRSQVVMELGGDLEGFVFDVTLRPIEPGEMERCAPEGGQAILGDVQTGKVVHLKPAEQAPGACL